MSKYGKLIKNTLSFAVGNFGSKALQFLLLPYYTRALSTGDYGTIDLITQTVNILVPLICLCIYDGVLRFAMDKMTNPKDALRTGFRFVFFSFLLCVPLFIFIPSFRSMDNIDLIVLIVVLQSFRTLFAQYIRALGFIKLYSLSGVVQTFVLAASNIIFLSGFALGVRGYLLSIVLSDLVSMLILFIGTGLAKDLLHSEFDGQLLRNMLRYSVPLVPNSVMWWGMNASNRYFLVHYHGMDANGLYAVASKIPAVLTMLMTIFTQAWQLSAIEEYDSEDNSKYYSKVYSVLESFLFISCVGLMLVLRPFWLSLGGGYQEALSLVPIIVASVVFSSLSSFYGSIYLAAKNTTNVLLTTIYGAAISVALNYFLIPQYAGYGAALSSTVSFLFVSVYRYFDTSKYIKVHLKPRQTILNVLSMPISFGVIYFKNIYISVICGILAVALTVYNNKSNLIQMLASVNRLRKKNA